VKLLRCRDGNLIRVKEPAVGKQVDGLVSIPQLLDGIFRSTGNEVLVQVWNGRVFLVGEVEGSDTSNMRGSHGGSAHWLGTTTWLGGDDVHTRGKDLEALAPVGEVGHIVGLGSGTHSEGSSSTARRVEARIGVVVTTRADDCDTSINSSLDTSSMAWVGANPREMLTTALFLRLRAFSFLMTNSIPATTSLVEHEPKRVQVLTAITWAFLARPKVVPAIVPATWVPWP